MCCASHKFFKNFDFSPDFKQYLPIKTMSVYSEIKILSIYAIWNLFGALKLTWRLAHFRAQKNQKNMTVLVDSRLSDRLTVFCLEVRWLRVLWKFGRACWRIVSA